MRCMFAGSYLGRTQWSKLAVLRRDLYVRRQRMRWYDLIKDKEYSIRSVFTLECDHNSPVDWSYCAQGAAQRPLDSHTHTLALPATHKPLACDTYHPVHKCPAATWPQLLSMTVNRPAACPPDDDDVHDCDCCYDCGCCRCCYDDDAMPAAAVAAAMAAVPVYLSVVHPVVAVMVVDTLVVHPTMVAQRWRQQQQPPLQHLSMTTMRSCSSSVPAVVPQWVPHN